MTQRRNDDPRNRGYGSPQDSGQHNQQLGGSQSAGWHEQPGGQPSPGSQQPSQYSGSSSQYGGISSGQAGSPYGTPYAHSYGDEQPYGAQRPYGNTGGRPQSWSQAADDEGAPYGQYGGEYGQASQQASSQAAQRGGAFGRGEPRDDAGRRDFGRGDFRQQDFRQQDFGRQDFGRQDERFRQRSQGQERVGQGDFGYRQERDPGYGREPGWNARDFNRGHPQPGFERENERRFSGHYGAVDDPNRIGDYGDRETGRAFGDQERSLRSGQHRADGGRYGGQYASQQRQDWNPQRSWNQRGGDDQRSEPRDWGTYGYPNRDDIFGAGQGGRGSAAQHPGPQAHHDPDYHQWRAEQLENFDNDYQNWRQERYRKFSDEFNEWRRQSSARHTGNSVPPAQTRAGGADTEAAQSSTRAALGGAAAGSEGGDLKEQPASGARAQQAGGGQPGASATSGKPGK